MFILAKSFAYSWRSSCSKGVNCGGGEFACEVESDIVDAIVAKEICRKSRIETRFGGIGEITCWEHRGSATGVRLQI